MPNLTATLRAAVGTEWWSSVLRATDRWENWHDTDFSCQSFCVTYGSALHEIQAATAEAQPEIVFEHLRRLQPLIIRGGGLALGWAVGAARTVKRAYWADMLSGSDEDVEESFFALGERSLVCGEHLHPPVSREACAVIGALCNANGGTCRAALPTSNISGLLQPLRRGEPFYIGWTCHDRCMRRLSANVRELARRMTAHSGVGLPVWLAPQPPTQCHRGASLSQLEGNDGHVMVWLGAASDEEGRLGSMPHIDSPSRSRAALQVQLA